jgi:hypothetical protein
LVHDDEPLEIVRARTAIVPFEPISALVGIKHIISMSSWTPGCPVGIIADMFAWSSGMRETHQAAIPPGGMCAIMRDGLGDSGQKWFSPVHSLPGVGHRFPGS